MGQFHAEIPSFLIPWIQKQHVFWVATAPLSEDGHVNVSAKGVEGTFHVIDERRVWYEDLFGSGVETVSHIRENGRITILFNAFEGPPRIARLYGRGTVYEFGTPEYNKLLPPDVRNAGSRSVIMIDVHKVGTSCGFAVPFFEFKGHRPKYLQVALRIEAADIAAESSSESAEKGLKNAFRVMNSYSIDGLPGLRTAFDAADKFVKRDEGYVERKVKEGLLVSGEVGGGDKEKGGKGKGGEPGTGDGWVHMVLGVGLGAMAVDVRLLVGIAVGFVLGRLYGVIMNLILRLV